MSADTTAVADGQQPGTPADPAPDSYSSLRLTLGVIGRAWLWFVGGCLAITLLPIIIGWRPYVVQSGSMEPRINVGDVILAAPETDPEALVGRVAVFTDPVFRDHPKAHRVIARNADGTLTTKGDANQTADTSTVPMSDVRGLARLLVEFVGLPLIWMWSGQWFFVLLFLASLVLAARFASRDHEDDDETSDDHPDDGSGDLVPFPTAPAGSPSTEIAASRPIGDTLRRTAAAAGHRVWTSPRWVTRTAYVAVLTSAVLLPTAGAAFAASARNTNDTWTVANWNYTNEVMALNPWLYWKLDDSGNTAVDTSGNGRTGTYTPGTGTITKGIVGALTTDTPNLAISKTGDSCVYTTSTTTMNAPTQLTEIVWFRTTSTNGGKLLGFEMPRTGVAVAGSGGTYDRHLYLDGAGKVWFGVYNGGYFTIGSPGTYNDGAWHMAAASMGTGGMSLYLDGDLVGTNANSAGETTTGWFRSGCGNLAGWGGSWTGANTPGTATNPTQNRPFTGSLDEVSIWQSVLTAAQIRSLYIAK